MSLSPPAAGRTSPRRSSAPRFRVGGVKFECWIVDDGLRYEWRSTCGRATAGRNVRTFWARADGRDLGKGFLTLRLAMIAAADALAAKKRGAA
jgi:hypothetical protein